MSLAALNSALDAAANGAAALTNRLISHSKLWKQIAEGPLGGYLDTVTRILQELNDPTKVGDRVHLSQALVQMQHLIGAFYDKFNITDFQNEFNRMQREGAPSPRPPRVSPGGGTSSAGMGGLSLQKKLQAVIDILNDNGTAGAGASPWYKPNDPDWLKIQESLGGVKGH